MKKILLFVCIVLPFVAVEAQTFQRKVQQPAFFMPKSAITSQQQERLPAVENMNYNKRRPANYNPQPTIQNREIEKVNSSPVVQKPTSDKQKSFAKTQPQQIIESKHNEKTLVAKTKTTTAKESKTTSDKNENYRKDFEQILNRHRADLIRISEGDYEQANDITELVDSFKPEVFMLKDTIYPRSVIIQ